MKRQDFLRLYPWARDTGEKPFADVYFTVDLSLTREEIWPFLCDTSRLNRALGLGRRTEEEKAGLLHVRENMRGIKLAWIEHPWTWLDRSHAIAEREFYQGPFLHFRCIFHLEDLEGGGVKLCVQFAWVCKFKLLAWLLPIAGKGVQAQVFRVMRELEKSVKEKRSETNPYLVCVPITNPEVTKRLDGITATLVQQQKLDPVVARTLVNYVKCGDDLDMYRLRPLKLAKSLALDERELLRACLFGTRAGLLNLSWDITCPHCRGVREETGSLAGIPKSGHCDVCDIDFSTQTENAVEITFHVHESIRKAEKVNFCSAEPAKKAHIKWQYRLNPGESRTARLDLPPGSYRLRELNAKNRCLVQISPSGRSVHWFLSATSDRAVSGNGTITVTNDTAKPAYFLLEELWWERDILRPGQLFCVPEFQLFFSRDCLATGVQLDLGNQTILFTDIVGSTKFYQDVGDTTAFAAVVEHFEALTAIIRKHDGAVIKTIGDAVMAAFHTPRSCLAAAAEAQAVFSDGGTQKVRLRASIHHGPVIAVNWDTGKDYFGHVVNFAAKLQSCADAGEVAVSEEFAKLVDTSAYPCAVEELAVSGMKENAKVLVLSCSVKKSKQAAA